MNFFKSLRPRQQASLESRQSGGLSAVSGALGVAAIGAVAIGAFAVGALAIRALAIRGVVIGKARIRSLEIEDLTVSRLRAGEVRYSTLLHASQRESPDGAQHYVSERSPQ